MTHVTELIKQDTKNASKAIGALSSDPLSLGRVTQVEWTHKRLLKIDDKQAQDYFKAA